MIWTRLVKRYYATLLLFHVDTGECNTAFKIEMQSEAADFAPGAATWRTRRNIVFLFRPICSTVWKRHYDKNVQKLQKKEY